MTPRPEDDDGQDVLEKADQFADVFSGRLSPAQSEAFLQRVIDQSTMLKHATILRPSLGERVRNRLRRALFWLKRGWSLASFRLRKVVSRWV